MNRVRKNLLPKLSISARVVPTTVEGPPSLSPIISVIGDTGTTVNLATVDTPVINKVIATVPIAVRNPNGSIMHSTHEAELFLPGLPRAARRCHIIPALSTQPLLSIGQLCDAGCTVEFTATCATVFFDGSPILQGHRTPVTRLWHFKLTAPPSNVPQAPPGFPVVTPNATAAVTPNATAAAQHQALGAVGSAKPAELVVFSHQTLWSPTLRTLEQALQKGFLVNFPGLTTTSLRKYPPRSYSTPKGHLNQTRQNQRSTKAVPVANVPTPAPDTLKMAQDQDRLDADAFPAPTDDERCNFCYLNIIEPTGKIYTDQTGRFIVPSSTGNNYLMILYDYDTNAIFAEPLPNRRAASILAAYKTLHARLCAAGFRPKLQRLDNECSNLLKAFMTDEKVDYQLVPPNVHRRNAAERAIRTFKDHFIAGLCSLDPDFPLHLWDRLVPQAVITLNLLRASRFHPQLSAWAALNGNFDFNRTPLAPPGLRVLVHEKPAQRDSWSPHGVDGWYTGPALNSYRCYTVWIWATRSTRICDTLSWFPTKGPMPIASSNDLILAGIHDIVNALEHPSSGSPLAPLATSHVAALRQLTEVLTSVTAPDPVPPVPAAEPLRVPKSLVPPAPPATPLRVAESPSPTEPVTPPATPLRVAESPSPTEPVTPPATYTNSSGPAGKRRRQQTRLRSKRVAARKARLPAHLAAHTNSVPFADDVPDDVPFLDHVALHGNAVNPDTGNIAEYAELSKCSQGDLWRNSNAEEIGRLAQGYKDIKGTNTMFFIRPNQIPKDRKPTYLRVVCAYRPEKDNPERVRWTCGGDRVDYPGKVSTETADLTSSKILFNSVISTPDARFMGIDLKDFYLGTPMERYEYMKIPLHMFPDAILEQYNLMDLQVNGFVYVEIRRGMYGLPQAGRLANDYLREFLEPHGYVPCPITPGLWQHRTRDIVFTLVVDDFGVRYTKKEDALHLLATLEGRYIAKADWDGNRYCGLTLEWDYEARTCKISMPGYIDRALQRFAHCAPAKPEDSPHAWQKPNYGAKVQYADHDADGILVNAADTKRIQEVLGVLLYYARAVDSTMLAAIGTIGCSQASATKTTLDEITHLLNYCATHPDAVVKYNASDMVLHTDSDAAYLVAPKARSRVAGYHYLSSKPEQPGPPSPGDPPPPINGPIDVLCNIMREVLSSASEAEICGVFRNGKAACPIRATLEELGHPQPPTVIVTDNTTAAGIANDSVKQKRSKAIDMRFYWIRDRVRQGQFYVHWRRGATNKADYFSKHHPAAHHRAIRSTYLYSPDDAAQNYFDCLDDDGNDGHSPSSSPLGSLDPAGEGVLESQDPEVEQHSSSTDGPTTKGPAMTEPTDKTRQARLAKTEPDRHD
jgi:hypothetical protein